MISSVKSQYSLVNPRYKAAVQLGVGAAGAAITAIFAPSEAARIIGTTVLTGVSYGIASDLIACRDCIEYFTVGHFYDGKELRSRPINTLDPNLNAFVWGVIATWHVCTVAGAIFALLARAPFSGMAIKIVSAQLTPYLAISAVLTLFISHIGSRVAQRKMIANPYRKFNGVPLNLQSGWEACHVRNTMGYASIGVSSVILSVMIIAARTGFIEI